MVKEENILGIGLLRTLLAIAVVIAHTTPIFGYKLLDAVTAVQGFFIISGFYMTLILSEKYTKGYFLFYTNRLLRLYPIYFVVLLLTLVLAFFCFFKNGQWSGLYYIAEIYKSGSASFEYWLFVIFTNLTLIGQDLTPFLAFDRTHGVIYFTSHYYKEADPFYKFMLVPQAWTVSLEIIFYLIAPFLIRKKAKIILLVIFFSVVLRIVLVKTGYNIDPWNFRFFPTELTLFLMGSISYKIYKRIDANNKRRLNFLITLMILLFTILFNYIPGDYVTKQWVYYTILMCSLPFMFTLSKRSPLDRKVGELSYPIYMIHGFVILLLIAKYPEIVNPKNDLQKIFGVTTTAISIIFAVCLYKFIQIPVDQFRDKRVKKQDGEQMKSRPIDINNPKELESTL